MRLPVVALTTVLGLSTLPLAGQKPEKSVRLESMAWPEAEKALTPETIVVIPLGAGSKEHGPHLTLRNDLTLAEYLTQRVFDATPVVVAPTLTYHYYPAFLEYPGSTSLSLNTARDMTSDVVRTLSAYGPRRFYILNTGVSTVRALQPAITTLAAEGMLVRYTDLNARLEPATKGYTEQPGGTHADEVETSMMLYIDPAAVDMSKAVKDFTPSSGGLKLTRQRGANGTYSPTGIWGDPTFATKEKGRMFVEALVAGILKDIADLRLAPLPPRKAESAEPDEPRRPSAPQTAARPQAAPPQRCSPADEKEIMLIGAGYALSWANADADALSKMWATNGDIIHPDGAVERGPEAIFYNRRRLFARPEYRGSRHPLNLTMVRCVSQDVAIADGKWQLLGVRDEAGKPLPNMEGQVSLVVGRSGGAWLIEAYRYTLKPPDAGIAPAPLPRRPGGIDPF